MEKIFKNAADIQTRQANVVRAGKNNVALWEVDSKFKARHFK
jgi:hypothetical protein